MISKNISSFIKTSFCDWPGRMSRIIFVRGCNFKCPTCHNYELLDTKVTLNYEILQNYIIDSIKWIDNLTISGGEPTIYNDLNEIVNFFNKYGFNIKIDSNGSNPLIIKSLISLVSLFSIDIKAPYYKYPEVTGYKTTEEEMKNNFNKIIDMAIEHPNKFQFRTTLVPSLTTEDIEEIKSYVPSQFKIQFQKYKQIN